MSFTGRGFWMEKSQPPVQSVLTSQQQSQELRVRRDTVPIKAGFSIIWTYEITLKRLKSSRKSKAILEEPAKPVSSTSASVIWTEENGITACSEFFRLRTQQVFNCPDAILCFSVRFYSSLIFWFHFEIILMEHLQLWRKDIFKVTKNICMRKNCYCFSLLTLNVTFFSIEVLIFLYNLNLSSLLALELLVSILRITQVIPLYRPHISLCGIYNS